MADDKKDGWKQAGERGKNVLGGFTVLRKLGAGAMGEVFEVKDPKTGTKFALKVLPKELTADEGKVTRFIQEAKTVSKLSHKGIVAVHRLDRDRGRLFFVMDLVEGESLDAVLKRQEIGVVQAGKYTLQVAQALGHAHKQGIVHRDIKPANLMLDKDKNIYVTDFGVAKREGRGGLTTAGSIVGTPNYMSPEQARGRLSEVDARSDVYSLGATFYEMLTRAVPFTAENANAVIRKVIDDDPIPPSRINGRIPKALELICLKAMRKSKKRRYSSAGEMAGDLQRWLDGRPVAARPEALVDRMGRWIRRHKGFSFGTLTVVLLAGVLGLLLKVSADASRADREKRLKERREKATALVEKGNRFLKRGRIDSSRKRFREALSVEEEFPGALVGLDRAKRVEKEKKEREEAEKNRADADALVKEGTPFRDQVQRNFHSLLEDERKREAFYAQQGDHYEGSKLNLILGAIEERTRAIEENTTEAMKRFVEALLLDPGNKRARLEMGALTAAHLEGALYYGRKRDDYSEARRWLSDVRRYNVDGALDKILAHAGSELGWRRMVHVRVEPPDARATMVTWDLEKGAPGEETAQGGTEFFLPPGSCVLIFKKDGYIPTRVPIHVPPYDPGGFLGPLTVKFSMVHSLSALEGMVFIPAGEFIFGGPAGLRAGWTRTIEAHETKPYFIDSTEVTNEAYARFLKHLESTGHPDAARRVPAFFSEPALNGPKKPVVGVDWEDAKAYAKWAGKRLPTAYEWEKAARGVDGRLYPWGNRFDEKRCVHYLNDAFNKLSPVRSILEGQSPYGCFDMAGNAAEWTADNFYGYPVIRGGSFDDLFDILRCNSGDCTGSTSRLPGLGFRCARSLD